MGEINTLVNRNRGLALIGSRTMKQPQAVKIHDRLQSYNLTDVASSCYKNYFDRIGDFD